MQRNLRESHHENGRPDARIRPAAWFMHAANLEALSAMLHGRADAMMAARDARAVFCGAYARYIDGVRRDIERGVFGEGAGWIERLELEHAHQYLRALDAWDLGDNCITPSPWRLVFAILRHQPPTAADALRMCLTVHLQYDLPLVLARTPVEAERPACVGAAYRTATKLSSRSARALAAWTSSFEPRWFARRLLRVSGREIRSMREQAWADGAALLDTDDANSRGALVSSIEQRIMRGMRELPVPSKRARLRFRGSPEPGVIVGAVGESADVPAVGRVADTRL